MRSLGISVYPNQAAVEDILAYIKQAAKYGYKRIFASFLLEEDKSVEQIIAKFKRITEEAKKCGMTIIADVEPALFNKFNVSYRNLTFFDDLGLDGIRLVEGLSGAEEAEMSFNPYGLKVELDASIDIKYLDNVLAHWPRRKNLLGCLNFYPRAYTGLSYEHFVACGKQFKNHGIRVAAFVNAPSASHGPWNVSEGICTLEEHRHLPIEVQGKHLFATNLIDEVIIGNAFASEEELKQLSEIERYSPMFSVEFVEGVSEIEKKIVLEEPHIYRGDISAYVIRSTMSRVKYKGHDFPLFNAPALEKGDVCIDSSLYKRYAGELQIALKSMKNGGKTNVVAKIVPEEVFLLDYLEPWMEFKFIEKK